MSSIFKLITLPSICLLAACSGGEQSVSNLPPVEDMVLPQTHSQYFIDQMKRSPERTQRYMTQQFSQLSVDDKVAVSDLQDIANKQAAVARAKIISDILLLDIDGTGDVSAQEMISISKSQVQLWTANNPKYLPYGQADIDKNNVITFNEMVAFSRKHAGLTYDKRNRHYDILLNVFNADNDDYVTRTELEAGLETMLQPSAGTEEKSNNASLKNNKTVKAQKNDDVKSPPSVCIPTPPSKEDQVIFVSSSGGGGYSSVALEDVDGITGVIRLVVEEGDRPLYIMGSTSGSKIWLLEGDTKRVKKFVTSSHKSPKSKVGVAGLAEGNVEFLEKGCLETFKSANVTKGIIAKAKWTKLLNRAPDDIVATERLATTSIPSGKRISEVKPGLQIIKGNQPPVNLDFENGKVSVTPDLKTRLGGQGGLNLMA